MPGFGTQEWLDALAGRIDASESCPRAAPAWELDPLDGLLRLRGDLATILRRATAVHELVTIAAEVEIIFPDER